jgi:hypothetical protein
MDTDLYEIVPTVTPQDKSENPVSGDWYTTTPSSSYFTGDTGAYGYTVLQDNEQSTFSTAEDRALKQNIIQNILSSSPDRADTFVAVLENLCLRVNQQLGSNIASKKFVDKVEMLVYDLSSLIALNEVRKKYPRDHALQMAIKESKISDSEKKGEELQPLGDTKELKSLNFVFDTFLSTAKVYGQFILEEYQFENVDKSLREAMIGGVAGGEKFIVK